MTLANQLLAPTSILNGKTTTTPTPPTQDEDWQRDQTKDLRLEILEYTANKEHDDESKIQGRLA